MKRYIRKFSEAGTGNYSPGTIMFKDIKQYKKAVEILTPIIPYLHPGKFSSNNSEYIDEYIPMTYKKNAKIAVKALDQNNVDYYTN